MPPNPNANVSKLREPFDATEDAAALSFVNKHSELRYCHTNGQWLQWDGTVWEPDQTVAVFDLIRNHCRDNSEWSAQTPNDTKKFCSPAFVAGAERFCKSDRQYAMTADQFDVDDWILNTPGGTVSLRTGELMPHDPENYCTQMTAVAPAGRCDRWTKFLAEITDGDVDLAGYLKRLAGYCLTGSTREHSLHFLYGLGSNGKSVFCDTLQGIMNNYAISAPTDTFTESHIPRHPTELAMLDGPRLVLAQETEEGRRWAETRIKSLTGGDVIAARRMRQDFFTFRPKFKLIIAGNHKPTLATVDEAMRRRFHVIPFTVTIAPEKRDKNLAAALEREWPGILRWAIEGCIEYCEADGLHPPSKVVEATDEYLKSQDVLHEWIEESCEIGDDRWDTPTLLFKSWKDWANEANEPIGKQKDFKARMEAAGFQQVRERQRGRYWKGISSIQKPIPEERY